MRGHKINSNGEILLIITKLSLLTFLNCTQWADKAETILPREYHDTELKHSFHMIL